MQIAKREGEVHIWSDSEPRYELSDDEETNIEREADWVMSEADANQFVIEMLRGPMGPVGPQGPKGARGSAGSERIF